jgi:hypothetical protein
MKMDEQPVSQSLSVSLENPAGWPDGVLSMAERALTCEFATLTRLGVPITYPLTPYLGEDRRTLDVSTGLTYPAKAERARRNPKVGLLFSDAVGTGLERPPVILVAGLATVRDSDLQANTDRYIRLNFAKTPAAFKGTPAFMLKGLIWYFARIWMQVTPLHILWWPDGNVDVPPQRWNAPAALQAPPSDPAPAGPQPSAWAEAPTDWRKAAAQAAPRLGLPILTVVGEEGFPLPFRVSQAALEADGFRLTLPAGMPVRPSGPACLTFHAHPEVFTNQENLAFLGQAVPSEGGAFFQVERQLADWSLGGSRLSATLAFMNKRGRLDPRVRAEAARRGQPVPRVNLPGARPR